MIYNVLFDLDGTLVDTASGIEAAAMAAVESVLPGETLTDFRRMIGPPLRTIFQSAFPRAEESMIDSLVRRFREIYGSSAWRRCAAFPGADSMLTALNREGVRCFVATNKPVAMAESILRHLELMGHFREVASLDSASPAFASKAATIRHIVDKYGLRPEESLFVGDASDDGLAAGECGMRFAAVTYGYGSAHVADAYPRHYVLAHLSEVVDIISASCDSAPAGCARPGTTPDGA